MEVKAASLDSFDETKNYDVASSTTEDVSTCSDRSSKCSQLVDNSRKSMSMAMEVTVTVTVISLDGVLVKKYQPKSKLPTKQKKTLKTEDTAANIVASFSQDLSKQKVDLYTHLPSLPIEIMMSESSSNSNNPVVKWPTSNNIEEKQALSTVQLTREFHRETTSDNNTLSTKNRFVPQMCPINISISRHGKLINLGKASPSLHQRRRKR